MVGNRKIGRSLDRIESNYFIFSMSLTKHEPQ